MALERANVGRLAVAAPTVGTLLERDVIATATIDGARLMGGRGSIPGTLIACIILGTLCNGLTLMDVQAFYPLLATGIIIIVAMLIDKDNSGNQGKDMGDPRAVGAQIRMRLPSLTPLEGKVAADILARRDINLATPLREVAEVTVVSDAMVIKVAKKLGFAGPTGPQSRRP